MAFTIKLVALLLIQMSLVTSSPDISLDTDAILIDRVPVRDFIGRENKEPGSSVLLVHTEGFESGERVEFKRFYPVPSQCKTLPEDWLKTVDTRNNCVYLYIRDDCKGSRVVLQPDNNFHSDVRNLFTSVQYPQGRSPRSIARCNPEDININNPNRFALV